MTFKPSKKRQRRAPDPILRGNPIIPSAAIERWYRRELNGITAAMLREYREALLEVGKIQMPVLRAMDEAPSVAFNTILNSLRQRWSKIFESFARQTVRKFVDDTETAATSATLFSLSTAGLVAPESRYNEGVQNTLQATTLFNHTLITNISQKAHENIYAAVMESLTSSDPARQGMAGITSAVKHAGIECKKRIRTIARDQTSKLYSAVSDERMLQNGVEEFEWEHSSAGKTQRQSHVEKDGQVFKINDPRLWEGPKADQGPPGWAINCRCRKRPVIAPRQAPQ